ncbi:MAG: cytochrome c3 family protein [Candidatus Methylomirabilia bacterium]
MTRPRRQSRESRSRRQVRPVITAILIAIGLGTLLAGSISEPATEAELQGGREVYAKRCAACHGAEGKGDGPAGVALPIKPSDLTDGRVMNPLPDHFLATIIREGGEAVGLSPLMPAWKVLSPTETDNVIAYMRTLADPPYLPQQVLPVPRQREGPEQPIFFSHLIHAGSYKIDCQYCHAGARRSIAAGIPSVERCMGCHKIVAALGNPEVTKLHGYWQRQEPIPWVRVFKLPEYVYFPHKAHIRANVRCQTCHGRIEAMERVHAQTGWKILNDLANLTGLALAGLAAPPPLTMGWCVECHSSTNATQKTSAPSECMSCHH